MTGPDPAAERSMSARLETVIREATGVTVGPDASFFEAGLTSVTLVRVHALLCARLGRDLPVWLPFKYPSRRALSRYLVREPAVAPAPVVAPQRALTPEHRRDLRARIRARGR